MDIFGLFEVNMNMAQYLGSQNSHLSEQGNYVQTLEYAEDWFAEQ
jgi:hypothetical protein